MIHLFYTHASDGWVLGKHFTHHVVAVTEDEAAQLLGTFWRYATEAEVKAAKPVEADAEPVKKPARKARS